MIEVRNINDILQNCVAPCIAQEHILSCYFMIKSSHMGIQLYVTMFYDSSKNNVDISRILSVWNVNGLTMEEYRTNQENGSNIMRVLFWSDMIRFSHFTSTFEDIEKLVNYDDLYEFINYSFVARYLWDPASCLRYCELCIHDELSGSQHHYKLDSRYLETCVSSHCDSVGLILNLHQPTSMLKWPESSSNIDSDTIQMHVIVCNSDGTPYTMSNHEDMKIKTEWATGFIPRRLSKKGHTKFDFKWLKKDFGIIIMDDLCIRESGVAVQSTPITLECDPKTKKFVHDIVVVIYEKMVKRYKEKIYMKWKSCLKAIQKSNSLFLDTEKWEKQQETEVYLPATVSSLVNIIAEASESLKIEFAKVLDFESVDELDDLEKLNTTIEKQLRKKMCL